MSNAGEMVGSSQAKNLVELPDKRGLAQVQRRESGIASDCKHQSASNKHGHGAEHIISWMDGAEQKTACEIVPN